MLLYWLIYKCYQYFELFRLEMRTRKIVKFPRFTKVAAEYNVFFKCFPTCHSLTPSVAVTVKLAEHFNHYTDWLSLSVSVRPSLVKYISKIIPYSLCTLPPIKLLLVLPTPSKYHYIVSNHFIWSADEVTFTPF
jgi:hypothetical protein